MVVSDALRDQQSWKKVQAFVVKAGLHKEEESEEEENEEETAGMDNEEEPQQVSFFFMSFL